MVSSHHDNLFKWFMWKNKTFHKTSKTHPGAWLLLANTASGSRGTHLHLILLISAGRWLPLTTTPLARDFKHFYLNKYEATWNLKSTVHRNNMGKHYFNNAQCYRMKQKETKKRQKNKLKNRVPQSKIKMYLRTSEQKTGETGTD